MSSTKTTYDSKHSDELFDKMKEMFRNRHEDFMSKLESIWAKGPYAEAINNVPVVKFEFDTKVFCYSDKEFADFSDIRPIDPNLVTPRQFERAAHSRVGIQETAMALAKAKSDKERMLIWIRAHCIHMREYSLFILNGAPHKQMVEFIDCLLGETSADHDCGYWWGGNVRHWLPFGFVAHDSNREIVNPWEYVCPEKLSDFVLDIQASAYENIKDQQIVYAKYNFVGEHPLTKFYEEMEAKGWFDAYGKT